MNTRSLLLVAFMASVSTAAHADVIFSTGDPFGGPLGVTGFDVCTTQSVAVRFTPDHDCALSTISLWLMSNAPSDGPEPVVTVSLRTNMNPGSQYVSAPSTQSLDVWTRPVAAAGRSPAFQPFNSTLAPVLHAGQAYWIVAESATASGEDPVWNWSGQYNAFVATNHGAGTQWSSGNNIAFAAEVDAGPVPPPCGSADFNGDGDVATDADIEAFFACLAGNCCATCGSADFNGDGDVATDADIEAFFRVLAGGNC